MSVEPLEQRLLLAGDTEIEPNNIITQATALTLLDDPASSGMWTAYGEGAINPATSGDYWSDPDYWKFPALVGDVVLIFAQGDGCPGRRETMTGPAFSPFFARRFVIPMGPAHEPLQEHAILAEAIGDRFPQSNYRDVM